MATIDSMMTVAEVAHELGVTDGRVRQIIIAGEIKATRVGGRLLLIEKREFEKFKKSRE